MVGNFVCDSGASYYLIAFVPFVRKNLLLPSGFVPWFTSATVSMGHSSTVFTGNFEEMNFGNTKLQNFPGVLQAHSRTDENWITHGDGSLGIETIRRFNFTLDLAQHKIHFTPNKYYHLPVNLLLAIWYSQPAMIRNCRYRN